MIKCQWKNCKNEAAYIIDWEDGMRPAMLIMMTDQNFVCEFHFKFIKKSFPAMKFDVYTFTFTGKEKVKFD